MSDIVSRLAQQVHEVICEQYDKNFSDPKLEIRTSFDFWFKLLDLYPHFIMGVCFRPNGESHHKFLGHDIRPDRELRDKDFIITVIDENKGKTTLSWKDLPFNRSPDGKHSR